MKMRKKELIIEQQNTPECCFMSFFKNCHQNDQEQKRNGIGLKNYHKEHIHRIQLNQLNVPKHQKQIKKQDRSSYNSNHKPRSSLKLKKSHTHKNLQFQSITQSRKHQPYQFAFTRTSLDPEMLHANYYVNNVNSVNNESVNRSPWPEEENNRYSHGHGYGHGYGLMNNHNNLNGNERMRSLQYSSSQQQKNKQISQINMMNNRNFINTNQLQIKNNNNMNKNLQKSVDKLNFSFFDLSKTSTFREVKNSQTSLRHNFYQNHDKTQITTSPKAYLRKQSIKNKMQSDRKRHDRQQTSVNQLTTPNKQLVSQEMYQIMDQNNFVQSYILDVKQQQKHDQNDHNEQKQFQSIKTKGKAVQSLVFVSKDLRKTKKFRNADFIKAQHHFRSLQNITVNSEYEQQQQESQIRQKIEQSAVLLNFFNPPSHIKDKLLLSRANNVGMH